MVTRHQSSCDLKDNFHTFENQFCIHIRASHHSYKPFQCNALLFYLLNKPQHIEQYLVRGLGCTILRHRVMTHDQPPLIRRGVEKWNYLELMPSVRLMSQIYKHCSRFNCRSDFFLNRLINNRNALYCYDLIAYLKAWRNTGFK